MDKNSYDKKVDNLTLKIREMTTLICDSFEQIKKLVKEDKESFDHICANEERVNELELSVEDNFIELLATESPVASDLRYIVAAIKIVAHLERTGDYAFHITKEANKIKEQITSIFSEAMLSMIDLNIKILKDSIDAFIARDAARAREAARVDDQIDELHDIYLDHLLNVEKMHLNNKEFMTALYLIRNLERAGDQATNICEWVVYAKECKHVELNE